MKRLTVIGLLMITALTEAAVIEDQSVIAWHPDQPLVIGGNSEQKIAQTFTAGVTGQLDHVTLALSCPVGSTGRVTIEIQSVDASGQPSGEVLSAASRSAATTVMDPITLGMDIDLSGPAMISGVQYAIVIRAEDGARCQTLKGPCGTCFFNTPGGNAWFDARPNPPGWVPLDPNARDDIPFRTWVHIDEPESPRFCELRSADGTPNDWLPNDVPVCGCLTDPLLRTNRCWFTTPDLMLWRDLPELGNGASLMQWTLLNHRSGLVTLTVAEQGLLGNFLARPARFIKPITHKPVIVSRRFRGLAERSTITVVYDRGNGPITLIFETLLTEDRSGL